MRGYRRVWRFLQQKSGQPFKSYSSLKSYSLGLSPELLLCSPWPPPWRITSILWYSTLISSGSTLTIFTDRPQPFFRAPDFCTYHSTWMAPRHRQTQVPAWMLDVLFKSYSASVPFSPTQLYKPKPGSHSFLKNNFIFIFIFFWESFLTQPSSHPPLKLIDLLIFLKLLPRS